MLYLFPLDGVRLGPNSNLTIDVNNKVSDGFLTADQKTEAIDIALKYNETEKLLSTSNTTFDILPVGPGNIEYLKTSELIVTVPIQAITSYWAPDVQYTSAYVELYHVLVDLNDRRVLGFMKSDLRGAPINGSVIIPSGAYWYLDLSSWNQYYEINNITFTPADAKLYPYAMSYTNFQKFSNHTSYEPLQIYDFRTNNTSKINGIKPIEQGAKEFITAIDQTSVFVLKNDGAKEATIKYNFSREIG